MNERPQNIWKTMNTRQKAEYIIDYYKFHIGVAFVIILIIANIINGILTHKDTVLSVTASNLYVSESTEPLLTTDFLQSKGIDTKKNKAEFYSITVTEDESDTGYTYASQMKLMTMISAQNLDVILMDKSSYELFSSSGYLMDLSKYVSDTSLFTKGNTDCLVLPDADRFIESNDQNVYLGIAENTPHQKLALDYIDFLLATK